MRFFASLALAATFIAAGTSIAAAWSFGNVYQEKASLICTGAKECAKSFPEVPAGKLLRVTHLSCAAVGGADGVARQLFIRLTNKATAETMVIQQPVNLKARADAKTWSVVEGTADFFIPANATIEFVYIGSPFTRVDCVLAGLLSKAS